jgi:hypothetical protein
MNIILKWAGKRRKQRQPNRDREEGPPAMPQRGRDAKPVERL